MAKEQARSGPCRVHDAFLGGAVTVIAAIRQIHADDAIGLALGVRRFAAGRRRRARRLATASAVKA
jgi:hypothetical protein